MKGTLNLWTTPNCFLCGNPVFLEPEANKHVVCQFGLKSDCETMIMVVCEQCVMDAVEEKVGKKFWQIFQKKEVKE